MMSRRTTLFLGLIIAAGSASLLAALYLRPEPRTARPRSGDRVQPEISVVGDWQAGTKAHFTVRLWATGPGDATPALLLNAEVPEDFIPDLEVVFLRGDEALTEPAKIIIERCC